jgi:hypothetical protein
VKAEWSQRLLRKGVLVDETYGLFAGWEFCESIEANLARGLSGRQTTQGWDDEVVSTVRRRIRHFDRVKPLVVLAKRGMPLRDWRDCFRLWVGATEEPFSSATVWLEAERNKGRSEIRTDDLLEVVDAAAAARTSKAPPLSEYSRIRAARDVLKTAVDLGMLTGSGPAKNYPSIAMSDNALAFYAQLIADLEGDPSRVAQSDLWRMAFLGRHDVHLTLLHLHQFHRLDYQVAGSLAQLGLPFGSAAEFAAQVEL